jgi:hypothetical protein
MILSTPKFSRKKTSLSDFSSSGNNPKMKFSLKLVKLGENITISYICLNNYIDIDIPYRNFGLN